MKPKEESKIRDQYESTKSTYERFSGHIVNACNDYKHEHPTQIRLVFSREPKVKTFESLINKIEKKRATDKPKYSYNDIEDLVALTVLCPYSSDVTDFIIWLKKRFCVTEDGNAKRDDPSGHRGYHYVFSLNQNELLSQTQYIDLKCEIQIKTILEEAFDAKSHDLTYKTNGRHISDELKDQFKMLSNVLFAVDEQSEFLKGLILEEENQIALRRKACAKLYLNEKEVRQTAEQCGIKLETQEDSNIDINDIVNKLEGAANNNGGLNQIICHCAALCALNTGDDYLRNIALRYCGLLKEKEKNSASFRVSSAIKWALGDIKDGINDMEKAIDIAITENDANSLALAKSSFIYFVSDLKSYKNYESSEWSTKAKEYATEQLNDIKNNDLKDTLGYYLISFGETLDEIDKGRKLNKEAHSEPQDDYASFYRYHEFIALKKLQKYLMCHGS